MHPKSSYTVESAARITGIEPARLRFLEMEFKEFFQSAATLQTATFAEWELDLFVKLHDLVFVQGEPLAFVHERLHRNHRRPQIIATTSGKGGVGKTTISVNLAIAFSQQGLRTLLVDADMGLGNVHVFAGINPRGTALDVVEGKAPIAELLSDGPAGLKVLCGCSGNARLASLSGGLLDRLVREISALAATFDVAIIDTGAGIADQVTKFLAAADDIVVVSTPNIASTLDAYGTVKVCREAGMRGRMRLIVNQAESEADADAVSNRISQCAQRFLSYDLPTLGWLPRERAIEEANQTRRPIVAHAPDSADARLFQNFSRSLRQLHDSAAASPNAAADAGENLLAAGISAA